MHRGLCAKVVPFTKAELTTFVINARTPERAGGEPEQARVDHRYFSYRLSGLSPIG